MFAAMTNRTTTLVVGDAVRHFQGKTPPGRVVKIVRSDPPFPESVRVRTREGLIDVPFNQLIVDENPEPEPEPAPPDPELGRTRDRRSPFDVLPGVPGPDPASRPEDDSDS